MCLSFCITRTSPLLAIISIPDIFPMLRKLLIISIAIVYYLSISSCQRLNLWGQGQCLVTSEDMVWDSSPLRTRFMVLEYLSLPLSPPSSFLPPPPHLFITFCYNLRIDSNRNTGLFYTTVKHQGAFCPPHSPPTTHRHYTVDRRIWTAELWGPHSNTQRPTKSEGQVCLLV